MANTDIVIRNAREQDIPQLKALWQEAFGDDMEDIELFFDTAFCAENTWIETVGERIRGVLYSMDCSLSGMRGRYFYALATALSDRRQGVMGRLLKEALHSAQKEGCSFVWLQPAEEELFAYYEKNGLKRRIPHRDDCPENLIFDEWGRRYLEAQKPTDEDYAVLPGEGLICFFGESMVSYISGMYPI